MKLAVKRGLNLHSRQEKRKIGPEDDEHSLPRIKNLFHPELYVDLIHDDYQKEGHIQTSKKHNHRKRTAYAIPISKTPHGTRVNRTFPRGIDLSYQQLVEDLSHSCVKQKSSSFGLDSYQWNIAYLMWISPLKTPRPAPANSAVQQTVNSSPRYVVFITLTISAL
jgi:hypothetical protein